MFCFFASGVLFELRYLGVQKLLVFLHWQDLCFLLKGVKLNGCAARVVHGFAMLAEPETAGAMVVGD